MKLRSRVIALIVALFVALTAAQLAVQEEILLPSFAALERQSARTDMARVLHAMYRELDVLEVSALNWGNWSDTFRFMHDRNAEYVRLNLYPAAITSMKIDTLVLIGADGKYVFAAAYDSKTGGPLDIDFVTRGSLPDDHPWRKPLRDGTSVIGLIGTNHGAMMAALSPILDGNGQGANRGAVLVGKLLTATEIARIGEQAQTRLELADLQRTGSPVPSPIPAAALREGEDALVELPTVTNVYRTLDDVYGRPIVRLHSAIPRAITAGGRKTVTYAVAFMVATGAAVLILLVMALHRSILAPLARITRHAVAIGRNGAKDERLDLNRADELGTLAHEFDRMLDRLAAMQRQLIDHSFESGAAEVASGTLHNIGNAMTPLAVHVTAVQKLLHEAPMADVALAAAELEHHAQDPDRRADLVRFLRLRSLELADVLRAAQTEAATIGRQAQAVQAALVDQRNFRRVAAVVEPVALAELIGTSAELVPGPLRSRMRIESDSSVAALGTLRLARATAQQVFQNVLVNAAEAVRDGGRDCGALRIRAEIVSGPGRSHLHVWFQDDGIGIAAEDLPHIFERGYSTKARAGNSGIGLHWCATALGALGGAIDAASDGRGRGACLHVVIPIEQPEANALPHVA